MEAYVILKNFYVLEGLDGAGTTTQARLLRDSIGEYIAKRVPGWDKLYVDKEPTDSDIGKVIRKALSNRMETPCNKDITDPDSKGFGSAFDTDVSTMAYLFAADRDNHVNNPSWGIKKRCEDGIVLCDRYMYSTFAYQMGCDMKRLIELNSEFPDPEVVIYVKTPVDECVRRMAERKGTPEIYENREYLKKVEHNYNLMFRRPGGVQRIITVDGNQSPEKVCLSIMMKLEPVLDSYIKSCCKKN